MPEQFTPPWPNARPRAAGRQPGGLYYGWVLVLALGVTETVSWGILYYAFPVFLAPMERDLGWSRGQLTGAFSLALLVSGVVAVPVGHWLDRHGPRLLMSTGACAGTLLVLAWAGTRHLALYYVTWAGIGLAMAAVLYDPAFAVVATWFRRRRTHALTVLTLMAALASTIFIPLANWLAQVQGWRAALVTLAAILGGVTILPHALLLRRRPEDLGWLPDGAGRPGLSAGSDESDEGAGANAPVRQEERVSAERAAASVTGARERQSRNGEETGSLGRAAGGRGADLLPALRHASFRWVAAAFCLHTLSSIAVSVHLLPYLAGRGFDAGAAAAATGLVGAMQILGRLLFTTLGGRLTLRTMAAGVLLVQPVALLVLLLAPGTGGVYAFVALFGAGRGAATLARPTLVAELYGPARYGRVSGVLTLLTTIAQAVAPVGAGAAYDRLGSYVPVWWALVGVSTLGGVAALVAAAPRNA